MSETDSMRAGEPAEDQQSLPSETPDAATGGGGQANRPQEEPLKRHGDALLHGNGSRQGTDASAERPETGE